MDIKCPEKKIESKESLQNTLVETAKKLKSQSQSINNDKISLSKVFGDINLDNSENESKQTEKDIISEKSSEMSSLDKIIEQEEVKKSETIKPLKQIKFNQGKFIVLIKNN